MNGKAARLIRKYRSQMAQNGKHLSMRVLKRAYNTIPRPERSKFKKEVLTVHS